MFAAGLTANGGHPQIGKELGAKFSEGGFAGIESTGVLETWGTSAGAAEFTDFWLSGAFGPTFGDKAVARGIATQEKIDEWRDAIVKWKDRPGRLLPGSGVRQLLTNRNLGMEIDSADSDFMTGQTLVVDGGA